MDETFDHVYSSDLPRALQTASLALPGADPVQDARLREISRGVLEGKIDADLTPEERDIREAMRRDRHGYRPEGGENFADVSARVKAWLGDLPPEGRVIAFTHGGVVHTVLRLVLDAPGPTSWDFAVNNASLTRVYFYDGRFPRWPRHHHRGERPRAPVGEGEPVELLTCVRRSHALVTGGTRQAGYKGSLPRFYEP